MIRSRWTLCVSRELENTQSLFSSSLLFWSSVLRVLLRSGLLTVLSSCSFLLLILSDSGGGELKSS